MTWNIKNNSSSKVEVKFFARSRKAFWPSDSGQIFPFDPGQAKDIAIQGCIEKEQICFGAWVATQPNGRYWGVGSDGKQGCQDCCRDCKDGKVTGTTLDK